MRLDGLVFVGFNRRVAALDRRSGDIVWQWTAPSGSGYVSLLLDGGDLFVAVQGYTYRLDAATGRQIWSNPMSGFGVGVASIATACGSTTEAVLRQADDESTTEAAGRHVASAPPSRKAR
jgi:outer membrane protein assembly factor BamB